MIKRMLFFSDLMAQIDKKFPDKKSVEKAKEEGKYSYPEGSKNAWSVKTIDKANLVSSLGEGIKEGDHISGEVVHVPAIDIDFPVYSVPSRTPGHTHLYIDKEIPWSKYKKLLEVMVECGIVEQGFYDAAVANKMTYLRKESYEKILELEKKHQKAHIKVGDMVTPVNPEEIGYVQEYGPYDGKPVSIGTVKYVNGGDIEVQWEYTQMPYDSKVQEVKQI